MKIFCFFLYSLLCCAAILSCKKGNNDNGPGPGPNPGSGNFTITSTSPEYVPWGEELTITGNGFSTNPSQYSFKFITDVPDCVDSFQTTILSLSSTQIKIKSPIGTFLGKKCGPNNLNVVVTINGKSDTTDNIRMLGWPRLGAVCSHFGGASGDYFIPGDSALLDLTGIQSLYAQISGLQRNVQLLIGNTSQNFNWSNVNSCSNTGGAVVTIPISFAEVKCPTDADWNGGSRLVSFKAQVPGTNREDTRDYLVRWLPTSTYSGFSGPLTVSKSAGGNPFWTITGRNMYYEKVRFTPLTCSGIIQETDLVSGTSFYSSATFNIPLSVLLAPCTYNVSVVTRCGNVRGVGNIQITP